ncbi:hypothetical protein Cob_v001667 [Colletotrichum orbiculare MAFF 240422]|uniref:Uncharacterized protein n=1 Tax=Colletotrichum orbiculare (strain 104-T / ATCC 96160 / CBS 514.97 / LARS 414 / MAFF 240422) TaxID=1213857 RepID=A0A484G638_COLOR|nr:hypothetical protein Cob_v001667 [Colletotrichum orbiculare MAFF 240422]
MRAMVFVSMSLRRIHRRGLAADGWPSRVVDPSVGIILYSAYTSQVKLFDNLANPGVSAPSPKPVFTRSASLPAE